MTKRSVLDFFTSGTGVFTSSGVEAIAFLSSSYAKNSGNGTWPDIQFIFLATAVYPNFYKDFSYAFRANEQVLKEYYEGASGKDSFHIAVRLVCQLTN